MPHGIAIPEHEQQQMPARASASEQPEALAQSRVKAKQLMIDSLRSIQLQGLSPVNARLTFAGDLPVESFQCQLWEPARAVQELQPGTLLTCNVLHHHAAHVLSNLHSKIYMLHEQSCATPAIRKHPV